MGSESSFGITLMYGATADTATTPISSLQDVADLPGRKLTKKDITRVNQKTSGGQIDPIRKYTVKNVPIDLTDAKIVVPLDDDYIDTITDLVGVEQYYKIIFPSGNTCTVKAAFGEDMPAAKGNAGDEVLVTLTLMTLDKPDWRVATAGEMAAHNKFQAEQEEKRKSAKKAAKAAADEPASPVETKAE